MADLGVRFHQTLLINHHVTSSFEVVLLKKIPDAQLNWDLWILKKKNWLVLLLFWFCFSISRSQVIQIELGILHFLQLSNLAILF